MKCCFSAWREPLARFRLVALLLFCATALALLAPCSASELPAIPDDPFFRGCRIQRSRPGAGQDTSSAGLLVLFGHESPETQPDILGWKVFSRCIWLLLERGVKEKITLVQDRRVANWQVASRVQYDPSAGILVSSYRFTADSSLGGSGSEEVKGVTPEVLKSLFAGDFNRVNLMRLSSVSSENGRAGVNRPWRLWP